MLPCRDPVAIPHRDLAPAEAAKLWGADRAALGECRDSKTALAAAVRAAEGAMK